jgi:hypothetical protein
MQGLFVTLPVVPGLESLDAESALKGQVARNKGSLGAVSLFKTPSA